MTNPTPKLIPSEEEALDAWARQVRANRDQAEAYRQGTESADFYAPVAGGFSADPRRTDEPLLNVLLDMVGPAETWLDIGAGGGRYTLPIALRAKAAIAVDPSPGMLGVMRESMRQHGVDNVSIVEGRWPAVGPLDADVSFISHVGYDIEDIGPFLDAMERSARKLCVAVLLAKSPAAVAEPFWPVVHGVARSPLPALPEFVALQLARGRLCEVSLFERTPTAYPDRAAAERFLRQQLFIPAGGEADRRLQTALDAVPVGTDGALTLGSAAVPVGLVSWHPGNS